MASPAKRSEKIPYARHHIDADDIAAVVDVLRSDWLTSGPVTAAFEQAIAEYCGSRFAVALSSATAGLHAACRSIGIGPGDCVWTSPNSFVASATGALHCGARIDFVDIDPRTYNISATELERKLVKAEASGELPKALVVVHFGGQPCDLKAIAELGMTYGFRIIEDASHALGATYCGERIGSCAYSDATVFSIHAIKSIAAGEGGVLVTNRQDVREIAARFRDHGIQRHTSETEPWRYEQIELGFNFRLTEMQAALAASQLTKLPCFVARRSMLAKRYTQALESLGLQLPYLDAERTSAWHLYPIQVLGDEPNVRRRELYFALTAAGIAAQVHYFPIHLQPYFRQSGFREGNFPAAERYYESALSLPLYFDLTESEQNRVIDNVRSAISGPALH
ncbi:MAG TPA: UDP-4-amino-4,6-dideoxy-N-acetyl-beta-L-altrosamine transaminase [Candidatus Rubrimentiphilum sp.]|nr:UDP-4-amino-4,6-dideoxy-N-acetyl-beta-L-altrosamine transaminase [Candidatus Rubrimentiphilum sp.]